MSLHRIGLARAELQTAIAGVLDEGRVSPYPRRQDVGTQVWLDETGGNLTGNTIEAEFPVHITADGTDEAQVAAIDDAISRVWDACERGRLIHPVRWSAQPPLVVGASTRRHSIVTVRVSIAARTLCVPDAPGVSPIPPDQVQE